jgi:DNA-binding NarL/FixJ family response regulator
VRERLNALLATIPGAEVVGHASTADAAINGILEKKPEVVVLDIHLAEGSGFDVLRQIKDRGVEFYVLSNFSADPYRQLAGRLGARGFFDKTKEFERVRDAIAERADKS